MTFTSPLPDVELPTTSITDYVLRRASDVPDRPALIDGPSGRTITYGELRELVRRLAGGLAARGFGKGSTLALMAPNIPEYAVVFHGVATAGGTVTTINPTYTPDEVRHQLQDSGATILVTVGMFKETAEKAIEGTGCKEVVLIEEMAGLLGEPIEQVDVDVHNDVVVLPYSSGTTGLPKGVMLTHFNLVANLAQIEPVLESEDGETALAVLPFFHIYGMQVLMNGLLARGITVITMPRFDLEQALSLMQEHKVARFFAVPPMILAFAKHPIVDNYDLSSLKTIMSGAAPLGGDLTQEAADRVKCEIFQGYGMTELSPVTHATPPGQGKPGSCGVTVPNTECRIVDPDGKDLDVEGVGELWIRGPQVMKGYLNNDEATRSTIDDEGWLHTGDVGRFDADGHLYIVDRVKELIKFKGFQVAPAELEALVVTHPAVADVAVIGIPDVEAGELPKAFVVLKPGAEATEDDIKDFVKGKVATYKQLAMVEFVSEIPKSASGKILRRMLRDKG
ncbi:MAG TPA: 4-coumarate--CoA ligase family protein [Acidimicrobiales bacterium]|nr:4-coumarate--CoA ligase family protein [Acidimicrobiales bacterium]